MKFCKRYEEYMQGRREKKQLPVVGLKKLKKVLKRCRREFQFPSQSQPQHQHHQLSPPQQENPEGNGVVVPVTRGECPGHCPVCDGTFFPSLLHEMSAVVGCFNEQARKLLELHLASGFHKYFLWFRSKLRRSHAVLMLEGKDLVTYAIINSIAMRKILKKYDKVHYSKQGQAFKSQAQRMQIEILQSPWLCQLMSFYINLRLNKVHEKAVTGLFADCSLILDDDKPSLSCSLVDSVKLDVDLTCSICLDTVFDAVSLGCGHIFCHMCCCSAASVTIIDGLKAADPNAKCPLCRQEGVYKNVVHLNELNILLSRSCPDYWEKRLRAERVERVRQAKEHWESQCRAFMGM